MSSVPGPGFPIGNPVENGARSRRGRGRARVPPNVQTSRSFCSTSTPSASAHSTWPASGSDMEIELAKRKAKEDLKLSGHGQIKKPKIELKEGQLPHPEELDLDSESETVGVMGATPPLKLETKDFSTLEINPHCSLPLPSEIQEQEPKPAKPLPASIAGRQVIFRVFDFSDKKSGIFGPPLDPKDFPGWTQLEVKDTDQKNVTEWTKEGQVFDPSLPFLRMTLTIMDPVNLDSLEKAANQEWDLHVWRLRIWEKEERKAQGLQVEDDTESEAEEDEDDENAADNWRNDYPSTEDEEVDEDEVGGYRYNYNRNRLGRRKSELEWFDEDYGDGVAGTEVTKEMEELNAHFHSIEWTAETRTQTTSAFGHATVLDMGLDGQAEDNDWW